MVRILCGTIFRKVFIEWVCGHYCTYQIWWQSVHDLLFMVAQKCQLALPWGRPWDETSDKQHCLYTAFFMIILMSHTGVKMEWSNDGELLAIAGHVRLPNQECRNELRFYRRSTRLQMSLILPSQVGRQSFTANHWETEIVDLILNWRHFTYLCCYPFRFSKLKKPV